jgi:hypothetical protein
MVVVVLCILFFSIKEKIDSDNHTLPTWKEEPVDPIAIDAQLTRTCQHSLDDENS